MTIQSYSTLIENTLFELLPPPTYSDYKKVKLVPKVKFQSAGGYKHQRNKFAGNKYRFYHGWNIISDAAVNTLEMWIEFAKSNSFYYVVPDSVSFPANETMVRVVRIIDDEVEITPIGFGFYTAKITMEDL